MANSEFQVQNRIAVPKSTRRRRQPQPGIIKARRLLIRLRGNVIASEDRRPPCSAFLYLPNFAFILCISYRRSRPGAGTFIWVFTSSPSAPHLAQMPLSTEKISTSSTFDGCGNLESTVQHSGWLLFTGTIVIWSQEHHHKGWRIITMHFDTNLWSAVRQRKIFAIFGQQTANGRWLAGLAVTRVTCHMLKIHVTHREVQNLMNIYRNFYCK